MTALVFPSGQPIGAIYNPGGGSPSYVKRLAGPPEVWQNVGMGFGYGPKSFTATAGANTLTVNYQVGAVDVFMEGGRLLPEEFTATNGTSITIVDPCLGGERIIVVPHSVLSTLQGLQKDLNLSDLPDVNAALNSLGFSTLGKTLRAVADAAAGRSAIGAPPLPQTAAGVGQWIAVNSTNGGTAVLPAGGVWAWVRFPKDGSTSAWGGSMGAGVDVGGTTIGPAIASIVWNCICWRIA